MSFIYDDLANIRYNSFTGEYTPLYISNEEHVIPSSEPYIINLNESPQRTIPSTVSAKIKETSQTLFERSKTTVPNASQFNVNYDELANGQVRVNAVHAGKTLQISYYGLGSLMKKETLILGGPRTIKTYENLYSFSGENYRDGIIEIGTWNMNSVASISVDLPFNASKLRNISCYVRYDSTGNYFFPLERGGSVSNGEKQGYVESVFSVGVSNNSQVTLRRLNGGFFDSALFQSTGIDRGYIYFLYKDE